MIPHTHPGTQELGVNSLIDLVPLIVIVIIVFASLGAIVWSVMRR